MKNLMAFLTISLAALVLSACSAGASGSIKPGDKVGDFTITQGGSDSVEKVFGWGSAGVCQKQQGEEAWVCQIATDEKVNVSVGIYADSSSGKSLQEVWDEHTFKMFINDQPVDLAAFGWVDVTHPQVGAMRWYDIAIQADQEGEIVVRGEGVVSGQAIADQTTYVAHAP